MFCIKTIALFFLLNGFEMPISATDEDWIRGDHSLNDTNYGDEGMTRDFPDYAFPGKQDIDKNDDWIREDHSLNDTNYDDNGYQILRGDHSLNDTNYDDEGWIRGDHSLNNTNYDDDDWIKRESPDYFIESSKVKPSSAENEDWIREEVPDYFIESSKDKPSSAENEGWIRRKFQTTSSSQAKTSQVQLKVK